MRNKLIILSVIVVTIIGVSITGHLGSDDDARFRSDHTSYENAKTLIQQSKGNQAVPTLEELEKKYPSDFGIKKNLALSYGQIGQIDKAVKEFNAALKIRPALIIDGLFCAQYADVLFLAGRYVEALPLYKNALQYNNSPQLTDYLKGRINALSQSVKGSEMK